MTLLSALLAPGCLLTGDPVEYDPTQSPPVIISSGLSPDPRGILLVGGDEGLPEFPITASIISEDAGESVKVALYLDYGMSNELGQPFRFALPNFPVLPPATLADGSRQLLGVRWVAGAYPLDEDETTCHRLTLVVTHEFDTETGCPKNLNDSDQVTWHFRQCYVGECLPTLENCPATNATCPLEP